MKKAVMMVLSCWPMLGNTENVDLFERCLESAQQQQPGQILKVELKREGQRQVYEFDIRGIDGNDWDLECLKSSGEIIEIEREVDQPNHPLFKQNVKINEREAREIALAKFSGEITEVEYEVESDGRSSYEFDIDTLDGGEVKIEIDAYTGQIVEVNEERWQLGLE